MSRLRSRRSGIRHGSRRRARPHRPAPGIQGPHGTPLPVRSLDQIFGYFRQGLRVVTSPARFAALAVGTHAIAHETQHVGALQRRQGMPHQAGIKPLQIGGRGKGQIAGIFRRLHRPVVGNGTLQQSFLPRIALPASLQTVRARRSALAGLPVAGPRRSPRSRESSCPSGDT